MKQPTGLTPVNTPMYPAKLTDLKTVTPLYYISTHLHIL